MLYVILLLIPGGSNTFFHATLPSVLNLSNRRVTCFFFETFADITCEFFKCFTGSSCQQLELVNTQSGTGNTVTFLIEVRQFQINDTVEFIVRGSNETKSVDIQGMLTIGRSPMLLL